MRRPRAATLLNLCTAASLLLFLAVCTLWVWSYRGTGTLLLSSRRPDTILGANDYSESRWEFAWSRGTLSEQRMHAQRYWPGNTGVPPAWWPLPSPPPAARPNWQWTYFQRLVPTERMGFGQSWKVQTRTDYPGPTVTLWRHRHMPLWPLALVTAALPAARCVSALRRRLSIPAGHCRRCGYDLRATPDRCPECGAIADASRAPA